MLHSHVHDKDDLASEYSVYDKIWPYILEPMMGHTWDSYYYHHVKHHHVENKGPGDLSSIMRFQRDELFDFLCYVGRFLFWSGSICLIISSAKTNGLWVCIPR